MISLSKEYTHSTLSIHCYLTALQENHLSFFCLLSVY